MENARRTPECWIVTDGRAGMENQALGLAEAIERITPLRMSIKRIRVRKPWRHLPRFLWPDPFLTLSRRGHLLRAPYPDLWIACGRLTVPLTIAVKKRSKKTFTVQTQDPHAKSTLFDLVIPPKHDGLSGENIFPILGSSGRVTREGIIAAGEQLAPALRELPSPRVAALIGGPNKIYPMNDRQINGISSILNALARKGVGIIVVVSRRTGEDRTAKLATALHHKNVVFATDDVFVRHCDSPYLGALGLADHILVTVDSINMACEAAASGKPVHILPFDRRGGKFEAFHAALQAYGASRPYTDHLENWAYEPLNETQRAATEILCRWRAGH